MQTNFFQLLTEMAPALDWNIRITRVEDGKLLVCIHPFNDAIEDKAKIILQPIIIKNATPEELNNEFFQAIKSPTSQVATLFANMDAFAKSLQETRKKSQMEKEERDKEEKEKKEKKSKYEALMKKVAELEKSEKWGEAIGAMPKQNDYPQWTDEINKKLAELKSKHSSRDLFNS